MQFLQHLHLKKSHQTNRKPTRISRLSKLKLLSPMQNTQKLPATYKCSGLQPWMNYSCICFLKSSVPLFCLLTLIYNWKVYLSLYSDMFNHNLFLLFRNLCGISDLSNLLWMLPLRTMKMDVLITNCFRGGSCQANNSL